MPPTGATGSRNDRLTIEAERLLLVEGQDEVNLFNALMTHCLEDERDVQVIAAGGREQFPKCLRAIIVQAQTRPSLRTIGVVRDADNNPEGAFQSVCDHLRNVGYEPPESHGSFSQASPSVGVFVMPNGVECGAVETLCRWSVGDTKAAQCVKQYLKCLVEYDVLQSNNEDKSFVHAYLAAMANPVARVGEGARGGIWNFDSPAFSELLRFVRDLSLSRTH